MNDDVRTATLNLLARIHRDGGHHTAEVDLLQSLKDADDKIVDLFDAVSRLGGERLDHTEWKIVREKEDQIRRIRVPGGWLYQIQNGRTYSTAPGTCSRDNDRGTPTWFPPYFVPAP